ncbi:hypothetical protein FN846DRAFT_699443 [Sphaerosporella brunnea]|uniref:Uncharacterized protein n=1 Tax=Sphaerosporella brunnea TaxID=1250544 RepID=A0A5J5EYF7_9PEZI|nr:hypothetical protein FN846DRAFT_699443 [Sphaerosporella brunnea]
MACMHNSCPNSRVRSVFRFSTVAAPKHVSRNLTHMALSASAIQPITCVRYVPSIPARLSRDSSYVWLQHNSFGVCFAIFLVNAVLFGCWHICCRNRINVAWRSRYLQHDLCAQEDLFNVPMRGSPLRIWSAFRPQQIYHAVLHHVLFRIGIGELEERNAHLTPFCFPIPSIRPPLGALPVPNTTRRVATDRCAARQPKPIFEYSTWGEFRSPLPGCLVVSQQHHSRCGMQHTTSRAALDGIKRDMHNRL